MLGDDAPIRTPEPAEAVWKRVQREHRRVVALVTELGEAADPRRILEIVIELRRILPGHFSLEEGADGFFEEVRRMRPERDSDLEFLHGQHEEIVGALDAIEAEVGAETRDQFRIERMKAELAQKLRAHERTENELIMDCYLTDEGGAG